MIGLWHTSNMEVYYETKDGSFHYKTAEKLLRLKKEAEVDGAYRVARRIHADDQYLHRDLLDWNTLYFNEFRAKRQGRSRDVVAR